MDHFSLKINKTHRLIYIPKDDMLTTNRKVKETKIIILLHFLPGHSRRYLPT